MLAEARDIRETIITRSLGIETIIPGTRERRVVEIK
jgi:hypothetical protein